MSHTRRLAAGEVENLHYFIDQEKFALIQKAINDQKAVDAVFSDMKDLGEYTIIRVDGTDVAMILGY